MANDVAVIVGAGPGLGAALARAFAAEGLTVVAAARSAASLAGLESPADPGNGRGAIVTARCDATEPDEIERLFEAAERDHGPVAVAVFNAGVFVRATVAETSPEQFEQCWRVGCFAGFLVGREAARRMQPRGRGTILFTGATASLRGGAGFVNLASPKFGLRAVAQSLARELQPHGIHVAHVVIDGQIRSPRYASLAAERGPDSLLEPDAIAAQYVALHRQHRTAWTHELDLRPWVEKF